MNDINSNLNLIHEDNNEEKLLGIKREAEAQLEQIQGKI